MVSRKKKVSFADVVRGDDKSSIARGVLTGENAAPVNSRVGSANSLPVNNVFGRLKSSVHINNDHPVKPAQNSVFNRLLFSRK